MVLSNTRPAVHGSATPGSNVSVLVNGTFDSSVLADNQGLFTVHMRPRDPTYRPQDIAVVTSDGDQRIASDAMFGTVFLCGGQSNMVHPVSYDYNATKQLEFATDSNLPNLRLFRVGRAWSAEPELNLNCTSDGTAPPLTPGCDERNHWTDIKDIHSFSAVCYFTALQILRDEIGYDAPMGLVETDWGGSTQEAWTDPQVAIEHKCSGIVPPQNATSNRCPSNETLSPTRAQHWGCLRNGMVAPLAPSLRPHLMLWYQGEADSTNLTSTTEDYSCVLAALWHDWRAMLDTPDLPIFVVQLAPYWQSDLGYNFPAVRVGQAAVATADPRAGFCVTHDIGDHAGGVHPHNKTEVGRRLSIPIRRIVYNRTGLPHPEPVQAIAATTLHTQGRLQRAYIAGSNESLQVSFTAGATALHWQATHNCTECCQSQQRAVEVFDPTNTEWVSIPASVGAGPVLEAHFPFPGSKARYAWSNYPECVLQDTHGLPVGPFLLNIAS